MAFVELDECISIFSLSFFISFWDFMFRKAVIWISSPAFFLCLSHLCHAYMCSYVGRTFVVKILVSTKWLRHSFKVRFS